MSMIQMNTAPTTRQLRQFGCLCAVLIPAIGWFWSAPNAILWWLLGMGLLIAVLAWTAPSVIRPLFIALSIVAFPIGLVVSEAAMLLIYFGVFFPIGLLFKSVRRDALKLRMDRTATSYWTDKSEPTDPESYYRQY